jgi:acetoin utilization protein AcuB
MKISAAMTHCPYQVQATASLEDALKMMELRDIRHLPVVENGSLIGIVSERDIRISRLVCEATKYCPTVGEICASEAYVVHPDSSVLEVVDFMASSKIECALVVEIDGSFVGIFTTTDACRLLKLVLGDT